ncbi:MAG: DNA internalization-related competence protein ComEC/Rec2 [Lachnospiraceae bacterium]|nr:DNA internalization-related competence protein ComEC/Rec2 [Lachnospiraceae bacterium]
MNKRKLLTLLTAFLFGAAAMEYHCSWLYLAGGIASVLYVCCYRKKVARKSCMVVMVLGIIFGMALGSVRSFKQAQPREFYMNLLTDGEKCLLQGEIFRKEEKEENYLFYLKNCILQYQNQHYNCNQILVYLETDTCSIGKILCVQGKIKKFSLPMNEGNYNEMQYYHSLNIEFAVENAEVTGLYGQEKVFREYLYKIKKEIKESFSVCMHAADAGVMTAMVLGDKSGLDMEIKSMYQTAGISHFYSISGLHISMLGMVFYKLLRKWKCSYGVSGLLAGIWIWCYGILSGFGISSTRAIGMFLLLLYAKYRGRTYDRPTALALLAAVMVWNNTDVLHNIGFLLSFGAVIGVCLAQFFMEEKSKILKERLKENFLVSLYIQLVTIPILCCSFYEISVYSICINLFILPCMSVLFGCGIFGGICGCFSVFWGKFLLLPCHFILDIFEKVCSIFLQLPNAVWITGTFDEKKIVCWYCLLGILVFLQWQKKREKSVAKGCIPGICYMLLAFCLVIAPKKMAEVNFLDVGQGDGIFIANGDGTHLFIDGGSSDISKVGTYRILPCLKYNGVRQIDYWFVSHCDSDHMSGLLEVLEAGYKVKYLVVAEYLPQDEVWQKLKDLTEKKQIPILYMRKGQSLYSKSAKGKMQWKMECLYPGEENYSEDKNAMSLALVYENADFKALFAGDLAEEQEKILADENILSTVDVFKANHHGSKYSNSMALLEEIQPQVTVVSCGKNNSYGHPHAAAIERLEKTGSRVFYTMETGQITVDIKKCIKLFLQP